MLLVKTLGPAARLLLVKAHVKDYDKKDGTHVRAHETKAKSKAAQNQGSFNFGDDLKAAEPAKQADSGRKVVKVGGRLYRLTRDGLESSPADGSNWQPTDWDNENPPEEEKKAMAMLEGREYKAPAKPAESKKLVVMRDAPKKDGELPEKGSGQKTFEPSPRPTSSPWGEIDDAKQIAPGIWSVGTPSHGGFMLSPERYAAMPKKLRDAAKHAGPRNFEEDVEAGLVMLAFPDVFKPEQISAAMKNIEKFHPEVLKISDKPKSVPQGGVPPAEQTPPSKFPDFDEKAHAGDDFSHAHAEAQKIADKHGVRMAVGWQRNDVTGEDEPGYVPHHSVGPAFVHKVRHYVDPKGKRKGAG